MMRLTMRTRRMLSRTSKVLEPVAACCVGLKLVYLELVEIMFDYYAVLSM
jgi:hypothetical protein